MALSDTQNFINNKTLVEKLMGFIDFTKPIIEIGPGKGVITDLLIDRAKNITAIELDKTLCERLQSKYKEEINIKIINEDFLKYELPQESFNVVANIPFNITAEIIRKLTESKMDSAYLIMQEEAGKKYLGAPFAHSPLLSHFLKINFNIEKLLDIDRKNYSPIPKFDTSFIAFKRKIKPVFNKERGKLFKDFMTYIFERRQNKLGGALKSIMSNMQIGIMCKDLKIDKDIEIKKIIFDDWIKIFNTFEQHAPQSAKKKVQDRYHKLLEEQMNLKKIHRTHQD